MKQLSYQETLEKVTAINARLRSKQFDELEIQDFWNRLTRLIPQIVENMEDLKVCTGCGKLNIEELPKRFKGCCPDNLYVDVNVKY